VVSPALTKARLVAVFERQAWSEEELIDDAESLAAFSSTLRRRRSVKKSFDTTIASAAGHQAEDWWHPKSSKPWLCSKIVDLAAEDGRIVLRRA